MKYKTGYCYWRLTFYFFFILHIICQFLVTWIIDGIIFHILMVSDGCLIYWNSFWNNCNQASLCVVFWRTIKFVFNSILLTLERPTIKYCIVDQAGLPGPLSIFIHKLIYLFDFLKWILLRMLNDHCKCTSLWLEVNLIVKNINQYNLDSKMNSFGTKM